MLRLLVLIGCLVFAFWWKTHDGARHAHAKAAQVSPNGFQSVAMPNGAKDNMVLIFAPLNCPHEDSQRADALADRLTRMGVPNLRSSSFSINMTEPTEEQQAAVKRTTDVANGAVPAVFINGMGKSNPTLEEVVAEYERTK